MAASVPRIGALALVVALVSAAPAQAGWRVSRASAIARVVWKSAAVDAMQIRWGTPPSAAEGGVVAGWTDTATPGIVWLNAQLPLEWEPFCTVVLHEAGHLAGREHSDHGIMRPVQSFDRTTGTVHGRRVGASWSGTDNRCRDRGRPFLKAHKLL